MADQENGMNSRGINENLVLVILSIGLDRLVLNVSEQSEQLAFLRCVKIARTE